MGNRGIALQALGRFDEALACYARSLALAPQQPATLNMQGLALLELKRFDEALQSFDRAVEIAPNFAEAWCSRANALIHRRNYAQALDSLDRAEALRPNYGEALSNRAIVLNLLGRHDQALATAQQALALLPNHPTVLRNLADALAGLQRFNEALPLYDRAIELGGHDGESYRARADRAIELGGHDGESYRARARLLQRLDRREDEARDLEQAIDRLGESVELLADRARALTAAGLAEAGLAAADRATALEPASSNALSARVAALTRLRRWPEALATYERVLERDADDVDAMFGRAAVLNELDRPAESVAAFDEALRRQPDRARGVNDRGLALASLGRYEQAFAAFAQAVRLDPQLAEAHWNEALFRLLLGQFDVGWREYEWRWKKSEFIKGAARFRQPQWTGAEDVQGRTLFLHGEQGLGDVIQFARYAPLVVARGARVIVGAQAPLKPLLQTLEGVDRVIGAGEPLPAFDMHCPLMSLPLAFGTRLETIPGVVPYLRADNERLRRWTHRLGPRRRLRVGLAWSGNPELAHDRHRSVPLPLFEPLLALPADFVGLGKFVRAGDAETMQRLGIRHFGEELTDFADTAALTQLMDVVISVDTSIAHLAGALAIPLWLLISNPPEYRWLLDRDDSPWYPSARLFRQQLRGDWHDVIARVSRELERLIESRSD